MRFVLAFLILSLAAPAVAGLNRPALENVLKSHCYDCHDDGSAKGGLDLLKLGDDLSDAEIMRRWTLVHDRVAAGEMPPKDKQQPDAAKRAAFLRNLAAQLDKADAARNEVVFRRLNRLEFENTLRDLLDLPNLDIKRSLPEDPTTHGFDTIGETLSLSKEQMMAYLDAVALVLDKALGPAERPKPRQWTIEKFQMGWKQARPMDQHGGGIVLMDSRPTGPTVLQLKDKPEGLYRFRFQLKTFQSPRPIIARFYAGGFLNDKAKGSRIIGFHEIRTGDNWTEMAFEVYLEDYATVRVAPYGLTEKPKEPETSDLPGLWLGKAVVEGPIVETWPPRGRRQLLGDLDPRTATEGDAIAALKRLGPLLFRRPLEPTELGPFADITRQALADGRPWIEAFRMGVTAMILSPGFLYLEETVGKDGLVSDFALASRLSYFLWKTAPDDTLIRLATAGKLREARVLDEQVARLLGDPRSERFVNDFTDQWLELNHLDATTPDEVLYPEFNDLLRESMLLEARLFFREMVVQNRPVRDFLSANWTMLNGILADHYGISGVTGTGFQRVSLPADSVRGGLLAQAAVLKTTANGTVTSPVLRGNFVLANILGRPVPPPPSNVPAIEPDTSGATTLRQVLERHRESKACAGCHQKIDPPGFALEVFDPIGGERAWYRASGPGRQLPTPVFLDRPYNQKPVRYRRGLDVDASGVTPEGTAFGGFREYKALLAREPEVMARTLSEKLLTYALGRGMGFSDRPHLAKIVEQAASNDYAFRSLIQEVVRSELFRKP